MSSETSGIASSALSIDFESWVHAYLPEGSDSLGRKNLDDGFVVHAGRDVLRLLARYDAKATFFVVSEIHDWYPELVEEIEACGHEVALHSHTHRILRSESDLLDEMHKSERFIERFGVRGFRAPRGVAKEEYMKILSGFGIAYDSSSYGSCRTLKRKLGVLEVPISAWPYVNNAHDGSFFGPVSFRVLGHVFPFGSPYVIGLAGPLSSWCIRHENRRERPNVIGIHLWQIVHPKDRRKFAHWLLSHEIMAFPYCLSKSGFIERLLGTTRVATVRDLFKSQIGNVAPG